MAQTQKYNHITVTASADDDIVIHAGAKHSSEDQVVPIDASATEAQSDSSPMAPTESDASCIAAENPAPSPRDDLKHAASSDAYTPTSLEDIENSKMPKAQIIVIVLAILAIAAFIAWYVFFS